MSLTKKLLANPGLVALTVKEERQEIGNVGPVANVFSRLRAMAAEQKGRKISFAFFQSDFKGGRIPYWHVCDISHKSFRSTLSMEGLKQWGVL